MGESQEIDLWEDNTKETGKQMSLFNFFSHWFPWEKHLDQAPPHNAGFVG